LAAPPKPLPANMTPLAKPRCLLKYCDGTVATTYKKEDKSAKAELVGYLTSQLLTTKLSLYQQTR
jgi:hypothetical protein